MCLKWVAQEHKHTLIFVALTPVSFHLVGQAAANGKESKGAAAEHTEASQCRAWVVDKGAGKDVPYWVNMPSTCAGHAENSCLSDNSSAALYLSIGWRPSLFSWGPWLVGWRPSLFSWRPWLVGWRPSLFSWRPWLVGWRQSLLSWRPWLVGWRLCHSVEPLC